MCVKQIVPYKKFLQTCQTMSLIAIETVSAVIGVLLLDVCTIPAVACTTEELRNSSFDIAGTHTIPKMQNSAIKIHTINTDRPIMQIVLILSLTVGSSHSEKLIFLLTDLFVFSIQIEWRIFH